MVAQIRGEPDNIAAVVVELAEEEDCRHDRFFRVGVNLGACNECHWTPDHFIWECHRCDLRVCSRCRNDRYGN